MKPPGYSFNGTTADVGLAVRGADIRTLFTNAFRGTLHLCQDHPPPVMTAEDSDTVNISFTGDSYENLLVQLLSEVIFLLETRSDSPAYLEIEQLTPRILTGIIRMAPRLRPRCQSLKAVTYHELRIRSDSEGEYRTRIIFDI